MLAAPVPKTVTLLYLDDNCEAISSVLGISAIARSKVDCDFSLSPEYFMTITEHSAGGVSFGEENLIREFFVPGGCCVQDGGITAVKARGAFLTITVSANTVAGKRTLSATTNKIVNPNPVSGQTFVFQSSPIFAPVRNCPDRTAPHKLR